MLTPEFQRVLSSFCLGCLNLDGTIINLDRGLTDVLGGRVEVVKMSNRVQAHVSPFRYHRWDNFEKGWRPPGGKNSVGISNILWETTGKTSWVKPRKVDFSVGEKKTVFLYEILDDVKECIWLIGTRDQPIEEILRNMRIRKKDEKDSPPPAPALYLHTEEGKGRVIWANPSARRLLNRRVLPDNIVDALADWGQTRKLVNLLLKADFPISTYFVRTKNNKNVAVSVRAINISADLPDSRIRYAIVGLAQPLSEEEVRNRRSVYAQLDRSHAAVYRYLRYTPKGDKVEQPEEHYRRSFIVNEKPYGKDEFVDFALSYANEEFFKLAKCTCPSQKIDDLREKYYFSTSLLDLFDEGEQQSLYEKAYARVHPEKKESSTPPDNFYRTVIQGQIAELYVFPVQFRGHTLYCEGAIRSIDQEITEKITSNLRHRMKNNIEEILQSRSTNSIDEIYQKSLEFLRNLFRCEIAVLLNPAAPPGKVKGTAIDEPYWVLRQYSAAEFLSFGDRQLGEIDQLLRKQVKPESGPIVDLGKISLKDIHANLGNKIREVLVVQLPSAERKKDRNFDNPEYRPALVLLISPTINLTSDQMKKLVNQEKITPGLERALQELYRDILLGIITSDRSAYEKKSESSSEIERYRKDLREIIDLAFLRYQRDRTLAVSQQFAKTEAWEEKAQFVIKEICNSLRADGGALYLATSGNKVLLTASYNLVWQADNPREISLEADAPYSFIKEIANSKKPIASQNPLYDKRFGHLTSNVENIRKWEGTDPIVPVSEQDKAERSFFSFLGVPIFSSENEIKGVIALVNKRDPEPSSGKKGKHTERRLWPTKFSLRDRELLLSFADHIIPFVRIAEVYDEMSQNLEVIGHDLPAPLEIVQEYTKWIKNTVSIPSNRVDTILDACRHMAGLVGNINIVKVEDHLRRIASEPFTETSHLLNEYGLLPSLDEPTSLRQTIVEVAGWLKFFANQQDVEFKAEIPPPFNVSVSGHKTQALYIAKTLFQQVVFNILYNAIRYRGYEYTVSLSREPKIKNIANDETLKRRIRWDPDERVLFFHGQMSKQDKESLERYFADEEMRSAISSLYASANKPLNQVQDYYQSGRVQVDVKIYFRESNKEFEKDHFQIDFQDWGQGIEPNIKHRIFEKAFRSPRAGRTEAGSGFGLWLVKSAVEFWGGKVKVTNVHYPTTITLWLPYSLYDFNFAQSEMSKKLHRQEGRR